LNHVRISEAGCYLPKVVLTNRDVIERFGLDVDEAWIESRTGIRTRHWMAEGQTTSDMVVEAAHGILERRGIGPKQLDRIVLATLSGDIPSPSTATIVARKLGARCAALDISAACAGFLYGLDIGAGAVRGGEKYVLVMAADARSRFINKHDRRSVVLFADGAGGVLLEPSDEPGLQGVFLGAEGRENMGAFVPAGGAARPTTTATVEAGEHFLQVDGLREIFDLFKGFTREACFGALERAGTTLDEIDVFITHQGNAFLVNEIVADLGIDPARAVNDVSRHGNTSGATVPIALAEAIVDGRIQPGSKVLMSSVGAGYAFGAAVHQY
jgi:3-oxoacyl-[acyl-carrier-protein] synthase III